MNWTDKQSQSLVEARQEGKSFAVIADELGIPIAACYAQAHKLRNEGEDLTPPKTCRVYARVPRDVLDVFVSLAGDDGAAKGALLTEALQRAGACGVSESSVLAMVEDGGEGVDVSSDKVAIEWCVLESALDDAACLHESNSMRARLAIYFYLMQQGYDLREESAS